MLENEQFLATRRKWIIIEQGKITSSLYIEIWSLSRSQDSLNLGKSWLAVRVWHVEVSLQVEASCSIPP